MTNSQLENSWSVLKGKLKQRYGQLADDDLAFAEGKGEELLGRLREKLGISREELDSTLHGLVPAAEEKIEEARTRAEDFSHQIRTKAGHLVEDLNHRATTFGEAARAQGTADYDEAVQRTRGLWEDGEEYVRTNPRESLLVAVAAGFVAGFILFRR